MVRLVDTVWEPAECKVSDCRASVARGLSRPTLAPGPASILTQSFPLPSLSVLTIKINRMQQEVSWQESLDMCLAEF